MAILANNIFNNNLEYSGIIILVFAIINYIIKQNSYCETDKALCKNPILVSNNSIPNEDIASKSVDSVVQNVKCEPLSSTDVSTYYHTTNEDIGLYAIILTCILVFIIITTQLNTKYIIFSNIETARKPVFKNINYVCILLTIIISITNYLKKGVEAVSIWFLILIYGIVSIMTAAFFKSSTSKPYLDRQGETMILLLIAILVITIPNYKYVNELKLGHAFVSTGAWISVILESIFALLMGIALIDNRSDLFKTPGFLIIYIIIFITMVVQIIYFLKHIYNCVWKTYMCEPSIELKRKKDMGQVNIYCRAKLNVSNSVVVFAILALLFFVLPNEWFLDHLNDGLDSLGDLFD